MSEVSARESMEVDVLIVGAGPAGLAASIRLKQIQPDLSIVILEKGAEVGSHILSGAVIDPIGLDRLLPEWREAEDFPVHSEVNKDQFLFLSEKSAVPFPHFLMPPLMSNKGNIITSLGRVCRWLATRAESLGVEIYCGFDGHELIFDEDGSVKGVATGDMGLELDGSPGPGFARGMEIHARFILLGEGVRGSLSKQAIAKYQLDKDAQSPKFGIGLKEVWRIDPAKHQPGLVMHTFGWPLDDKTGGGSFLYHYGENLVSIGFVVYLNYKTPFLSPFEEFQRHKQHPAIRHQLEGGERISYGARAISEGGWQSVPKLIFPGGALLGCSAGLVNLPRIKGSHNAMLSGIQAAEAVAKAISTGSGNLLDQYEEKWRDSEIGNDLKLVRNAKPFLSKFGTLVGFLFSGIDMWVNQITGGWSPFGTLNHTSSDHDALEPARQHQVIDYPRPDGEISFDRTSSVFLSSTNHRESQPIHLKVKDIDLQKRSELAEFSGPSTRYCPAGVYEWLDANNNPMSLDKGPIDYENAVFQINSQNCVHCKTCDIKDPNQNINWETPEGSGGPLYQEM